MRRAIALLLAGFPLVLAVAGPLLAHYTTAQRGPAYDFGPGYPLGTDGIGRDVLGLVLRGGASTLALAAMATVAAYGLGTLVGLLAAATRHRWFDEILMRPLDVLLAVPALLVLLLAATAGQRNAAVIVAVVTVINAPAVARLARAAALDAARHPAAEAMVLQGESWWAVQIGYVARRILRPLLADAGARITTSVYLVGAANFLGIGLPPDAADWAVLVDRNRAGLFLQPWAVLVPAALIVAFTIGVNLLADDITRRQR